MEGRGYHRGPRTYLRELKFTRADYAAPSRRHSLPGRGRGASLPAPLKVAFAPTACPPPGAFFCAPNRLLLHLWLQFAEKES
ncbi:MAG: energy-coupling factor transporter transmembrane protein EcfT [Desulfobacterales bacterium]|nr:energy-coupling factor transporter transmembrane protein EcfT [Desulfobacterales bacterium]